MGRLSIRLLGPPQVTLDGEPAAGFDSDKVRALLFFLVVEPDRPHRREALAELLWPDQPDSSARGNLRRALANLRKTIADHQARPSFLRITYQTIQFNSASDAWCDVTAFSNLLKGKAAEQAIPPLEEAVELYRGSFLAGFSVDDSVVFQEWALFKQEQLERQAWMALRRLTTHHEQRRDYDRALTYAWRWVELEPWHEEAQRVLMRLLALNGQRSAALAQYEACRRALAEELDVPPARETTRLYEQIRAGEIAHLRLAVGQPPAPEADAAESTLPHPLGVAPAEVPDVPASPMPAQRHAILRTAGERPALVVAGLSALVIVGIVLVFAIEGGFNGGGGSEEPSSHPLSLAPQPVEGKVVHVCQDVTPLQLCVCDARTGLSKQVTDDLAFAVLFAPSWSPTGEQIVFAASPGPDDPNLYIVNVDGSGLRQITSATTVDIGPVWAPDGQWIAFHRSGALGIVRPDGSEVRTLVESDAFCAVGMSWSPDSQEIAYMQSPCGQMAPVPARMAAINPEGTEHRVIHDFGETDIYGLLAWSPDGSQIFCDCDWHGHEPFILFSTEGKGELQTVGEIPRTWYHDFWPRWGRAE